MPAGGKKGFGVCALAVNIIIVIILVFGGVAVYLHQVKYKGGNHWYHPTDMVSINHITSDLSTAWCHAYKVTGDQAASLNVYLLPYSSARLDRHNRTRQDVSMDDIEAGAVDNAYSLFLLEGSTLAISACRKHLDRLDNVSSQVLFFRGDGYKTWQGDMTCESCMMKRLPISAWCNANRTNAYNMTVTARDTYTVVLARVHASQVGKQVYVTTRSVVNRTRYHTTDAIQSCLDTNECLLNLDYNSDRDVVVELNSNTHIEDSYFVSECEDRVVLWVGVFLLVPGFLIFGLLAALTCGECYLKRKQSRSLDDGMQTATSGYAKMNDVDELIVN